MTASNHHACALEIHGTGILIKGSSGSGKTSLMLGLLERAKLENLNAAMIADDQVLLIHEKNHLIARVPSVTAGLVEVRGHGIIQKPNKTSCEISLVVDVVEDEKIDRMPEQKQQVFEALEIPLIEVPQRHESQAVRIVFAWLNENVGLQVS